MDAADMDLKRRGFGIDADQSRLAQAIKLGLLGGMGDVEINVPDEVKPYMAEIKGGARPSAIANRGEIVAAMQPRILKSLMEGERFDPLKLPDLPELSPTPTPGTFDKVLEGVGYSGLISDIVGGMGFSPSNRSRGASSPVASNPAPINTRGLRFG